MHYVSFTATSKNKLNFNLSPGVSLPSSPWNEREEERSWEQAWHNSLPCRCCGLQVALSPHDVIQKIGKVTNNGFYNTIKERTCAYTRASPSYTTQFSHALQHIYVLETHSHREDIFSKHEFPTQQKVNKPV